MVVLIINNNNLLTVDFKTWKILYHYVDVYWFYSFNHLTLNMLSLLPVIVNKIQLTKMGKHINV